MQKLTQYRLIFNYKKTRRGGRRGRHTNEKNDVTNIRHTIAQVQEIKSLPHYQQQRQQQQQQQQQQQHHRHRDHQQHQHNDENITQVTQNDHKLPIQQKLRILSANFRSLCNKVCELEHCLSELKTNVVLGCESWLSVDIKNAEIFPPDYQQNIFRKDRNRHGGGVFIAGHNSLDMWQIENKDLDECEIVWAELKGKERNVILGSFYRPPNSDVTYLDALKTSLTNITSKSKGKIVILGGDFNLPHIDWKTMTVKRGSNDSRNHHKLLEIMDEAGLHQVQLNATRQNNNLDLYFTNLPGLIENCTTTPGPSDHDMILVESNLKINHNVKKRRKVYQYKKTDWVRMRAKMMSLSNKVIEMDGPINDRWEAFRDGIHSIMDAHIPSKLSPKSYNLPWITKAVRKVIRRKNKLFQIAKLSQKSKDWSKYKTCKAQAQKDIRKAHLTYLNRTLNNSLENGNNKAFWKYIKAKRNDHIGVAPLKHNDALYVDSKAKAGILNRQFYSVFTKSDPEEPEPEIKGIKYPSIPELKIHTKGIHKLLSDLDVNKASGCDNIPNRILRECAEELAPAIASIFQQSIDTGNLPSDWRKANVSPIYKKGSRHEASNYRPVSLTSVCCKTLEHVISRHVRNHLEKHDILTKLQHGFRSLHSCESQLVITMNDIIQRYDRGEQVDVAILDFSKAFDTVPHKKLLHKLDHYGIDGNLHKWMATFLTEREQQVVVDGEASDTCRVESGVPQGTVLGPLLFLLHINDLPERVLSQMRLFADDCLIYRTISSKQDHTILQQDLTSLKKWADEWGMKFNESKCYTMSICRKRAQSHHQYILNSHKLKKVHENPYLGVLLSDDLKWTKHIDKISNKANSILGLVRRNLKNCPNTFKQQAYISLIRPILEYGCVVWDPYLQKDVDKLEKIQKRAARFAMNDYGHTSSVTSMLKELNWNPLSIRRKNHRLIFMHKIIFENISAPPDFITFNNRPQRHKNPYVMKLPSSETNIHKFSFLPRTIADWNSLPNLIAMSTTTEQFKERMALF